MLRAEAPGEGLPGASEPGPPRRPAPREGPLLVPANLHVTGRHARDVPQAPTPAMAQP